MIRRVAIILLLIFFSWTGFARLPEGSLLDSVKPGPDGEIHVLTVFAHEDDETIHSGGALLKLKKDPRVRLHILCLTLGDASEARYFLRLSGESLARIRMAELRSAAAVIGADEVVQFDYRDHFLKEADQAELVAKIKNVIESSGAQVVITHDPAGITRNPDHVACSAAATRAFKQSRAGRLYYTSLPRSLYWLPATFTQFHEKARPVYPTFKVNIRREKKLKKLAEYEHATQKHFSFVGLTMSQGELFNHEWFALAESKE